MTKRPIFSCAALLFLLFLGTKAAGQTYHPSQIALFDTPHLQNIAAPTALHYQFSAVAAQGGFEDKVDVIVTDVLPDGRKNLRFDFLTGERHRDFEPVSNFRGNPLIMLFLERDVALMSEATGGSQLWFRNRIKDAFWKAAMAEITVPWDGRDVRATQITIKPFLGQEQLDEWEELKDKSYQFVLSPDVPGGLYRIDATVPGAPGSPPVRAESVTLASVGG